VLFTLRWGGNAQKSLVSFRCASDGGYTVCHNSQCGVAKSRRTLGNLLSKWTSKRWNLLRETVADQVTNVEAMSLFVNGNAPCSDTRQPTRATMPTFSDIGTCEYCVCVVAFVCSLVVNYYPFLHGTSLSTFWQADRGKFIGLGLYLNHMQGILIRTCWFLV
jgi:hypothetical protein